MGPSHLLPMVSLAKLFLQQGLSPTIVTLDVPFIPGATAKTVSSLSSLNPSISFQILPTIDLAKAEFSKSSPGAGMFKFLQDNNPNLLEFLTSFKKQTVVKAIVMDFFCTAALDVANQLEIPAYFFTAFGASDLALFLHVTELHSTNSVAFKDLGKSLLNFPGLPPLPASDIPFVIQDRESDTYKILMETLPNLIKSKGILINTFESLELKSLNALKKGLCVPNHTMPPVYSIGPLVNEGKEKEGEEEKHETLSWLDSQPKGSVIFLCFGSMGGFTPNQIKNIAIGLENSKQRFLWVVKIISNPKKIYEPQPDHDLYTVLPEGFLDRTKNRGMVLKARVPQVEILNHESVAGFMTHCGWNSVLEAVTAGKPMICWPLYAEQRVNKAVLVEEIKIGFELKGYDEEIVEAEEVEKKVRTLMEQKEGKVMKERVESLKEKAIEALRNDGSSSEEFKRFISDLCA
ncbi:hypothetical protein LUZ60_007167 [Juncus effusus]|nr:hypothetical protein LUZ60_007167 [Juncus effusus]